MIGSQAEASFFPIPPDVMLIPMVIAKKNDFLKIFLIATIFSVLGGIIGYILGTFFLDFSSLCTYLISTFSIRLGLNVGPQIQLRLVLI